MKSKVRSKSKKRSLFDPTAVVTLLQQALRRDLSSAVVASGEIDPISRLAQDQSANFTKKYSDPSIDQQPLVDLTYEKFHNVNTHMRGVKLDFKSPTAVRVLSTTPELEGVLLKARAYMHMVLTDFDEEEWFDQCRNGPGTSIGIKYSDTSLEAKLTFPMSLTSRVAPLMDRYMLHNFQLCKAVEKFNSLEPKLGMYDYVKGSRATTVEKNDKIRRMIAIEPTGNMFFQQGLMSMMYKRMAKFGLDVEKLQPMHQERARISSITSKEATIDWSSASDCNSLELLKWLLPPKWFSVCELVRSPSMEIEGKEIELNMFSTMGNAVTFPLETLVFWTIGHAVNDLANGNRSLLPNLTRCESTGRYLKDWLEISVFGDDCIVPTRIAERFIKALVDVGFIINSEKSFYSDDDHGFRESCGGDYLHGYNVRPFNIKAPSSTSKSAFVPWLNIAFNRLVTKYITCFGSLNYMYDKELWRVFEKLSIEHKLTFRLVPNYFPDDSGLKISNDLLRLRLHYPGIRFAFVRCDRHGTYAFTYSRFIYRDRTNKCDDLHYVQALQRPVLRESSPWKSTKKKGGYVVAKGLSSHWTVPVQRNC